ncbi:MAG TPA: nucleotidyltransferase family protein [Candidatus Saccharimonadales bacterium]|nr:nucleotidyltransferase family protein [Candidatus Saccharimonadales bacterium]
MIITMFDKDLQSQIAYLERTLAKSKIVSKVLELAPQLELPNWYLGAGAICQTIWNELHGFSLNHGIKDYDLVYFDTDISAEAQDRFIQKGKELFAGLPVEVELTNEARVHLWYKEEVGKDIQPYASTEDAINTWPTTASAVGVRYERGQFLVYAPRGLNDMMSLTIRANKGQITREVYEKKVARWQQVWPKLTVTPWDE